MSKWFLIAFVILSIIPRAFLNVPYPVLDRLALSDVAGVLGIMSSFITHKAFVVSIFKNQRFIWATAIFILLISISALFSFHPLGSFVEVGIIFYLTCVSIALVAIFKDDFSLLVTVLAIAVLLASFLGLYDSIAERLLIPKIFHHDRPGFVIGGFRTTGQAGAFYMVFVGILIAYRFSEFFEEQSKRANYLITAAIFGGILSLLLAGKLSALAGLAVGGILFVLLSNKLSRKRISSKTTSTLIIALSVFIISAIYLFPSVYLRLSVKFENYAQWFLTPKIKETLLYENSTQAFVAFQEHLFLGTGLGAFQGQYHTHEVHGTYLKIVTETGLLGLLGYLIFLYALFNLIQLELKRGSGKHQHFLQNLLPFVIGFFLCWTYTYHLRKREFWILVSVIIIVSCRSQASVKKHVKFNPE